MSIVYIESQSPYQINFASPRKRPEVSGLGHKFVAHEQTLPVEEQTPHTPRIINLLDQLDTANNNRIEAERQRSIASDNLKRIEKQAPALIRQMWKTVTVHHPQQPSMATNWGFRMKGSTRNVLLPKTRDERRATMAAYIAREESRPEAERFTVPDLVEVITLHDEWEYNLAQREKAANEREINVERCNQLTPLLAHFLQAAAIYIIAERFTFKLSTQLENWGFDVTLKRRSSANGSSQSEPEAVDSTAEVSANGNGVAEGTGA